MKLRYLSLCIALAFLLSPAGARSEILAEPICFGVINEAPYTVLGSVSTDYYTTSEGRKARHVSNFRLSAEQAEEKDYPTAVEFCSYGPFYPGRKLEIVLRTLIPIFNCKTRVDQGPLIVKGYRKPEGGTETWIECFE